MYAHEVIADYEKFDLAGLVEGGYFWNKLTDKINRAVKSSCWQCCQCRNNRHF